MRLTLRTMLAYVNDLLEPADAEEMGKKITESEFATGLMHRMRDVTRRLRLGAPRLHGRGMGHDPNTVAEYLDHELPSDRVADFEKVCLESDVHLAEVASCHQILALVLGEPAEIEVTGRQRMYAMPQLAESTTHSPQPEKPPKPSPDGTDRATRRKKKRRKAKVPEYLREPTLAQPTPRRWTLKLAAAAVLIAVGVGLATYGPQIIRRLPSIQRDETSETSVAANTPSTAADQNSAGRQSAPKDKTSPETPSADSKEKEVDKPTTASPAENEPANKGTRPDATDTTPPAANGQADRDDATADTAAPRKRTDSERPRPMPSGKQPPDDEEQTRPSNEHPAAPPRRDTKPAAEQPARSTPAGEGIGRLVSEDGVLLREVDDEWQRVPTRGTVHASERLIALPTYRPSVAMSNGVTLQLLGGTIVSLGPPAEDGGAQIQLSSGRILLLTAAKPDTHIHLQAGDYRGTIEFGRDEAALAVEVRHLLPEGADPEQEPAPTSVDLYLSTGEATWVGRPGRSEKLSGRSHRTLGDTSGASQAAEELPAWIESSQLNPNERRAAGEVAGYLRPDKPVAPALEELVAHRRLENSLLAVQSLALIDDFEPIVPLLNEPKYHSFWPPQIESLRAAVARSPRSAAAVREAFQRARGKQEGRELYRMLWGYNTEQLNKGAAEQLIDWLGAPDDKLDYRVLSFWNLHHITGLGLYYQPADPEKPRRQSIQRWKQKLEAGLLVPKSA